MFDMVFALIAASAALAPAAPQQEAGSATSSVVIGQGVTIGSGAVIDGTALQFDATVVPADLVAQPQTPFGKFTTAQEVRPILAATKANWVAVREYEGRDLLYLTHLWSWRCGLAAVALSINDAPMQNVALPECHTDFAAPNAILPQDGLPYFTFDLGSVHSVTVQIVYDDLSRDIAQFARSDVRIP